MTALEAPLADTQPDPEELPADAASFPWGLLVLAVIGYFVSTILPYWKPLTWWLLIAGIGSARIWIIRHTRFEQLSAARRRWRLRGLIWVFMLANSSVAYFFYTPGDVSLHALLALYLFVIASILTAHLSSFDKLRLLVSLLILGTPTGVRMILEGIDAGQPAIWVLGLCTIFVPIPLAQIATVQTRLMQRQFVARIQAESEARALSTVTHAQARFFAAISHDLRQPVHAIGLYLEAVKRLVVQSDDVSAHQAVRGIKLSWETLNALLTQVLDLARLDANMEQADVQPLLLAPLLRELVLEHSSLAEQNGVRLVALVQAAQQVDADALMLKRVLSNLLGNAIKFSPPGRAVVLAVRPAGAHWRIQVRDAGCGISEADQALIFSEFVQLDNVARSSAQGFGLGLAIAKRLTELQGGAISVRSQRGAGCCMQVTLTRSVAAPLAERGHDVAPAELAQQADRSAVRNWLTGLQVLLVEDDVMVGDGMRQLLQSWGCVVCWAQTVEVARQLADNCAVAICDVRLGAPTAGLALASYLQASGMPVMLISGETDVAPRNYAAQHGLVFLTKPVAPAVLRDVLLSMARRR